MKRITIYMAGGVIQDIANIPEDVEIEVRDYDVDDDGPCVTEVIDVEEGDAPSGTAIPYKGEQFYRAVWTKTKG